MLACFATFGQSHPSSGHRGGAVATIPVDWRLIHSPNPRGGEVASIMQVAEPDRSDIGVIGMMIRCSDEGPETLLVVLDPLPPGTLTAVTLQAGHGAVTVKADAIPTGAGLILPIDINGQLAGPWRDAKDVSVRVTSTSATMNGVIPVEGLPNALSQLNRECALRGSPDDLVGPKP